MPHYDSRGIRLPGNGGKYSALFSALYGTAHGRSSHRTQCLLGDSHAFGFAMAGNVFSTMIQLCARQLDFLKQQVREMDRKIAEIMEALDTPITTITGIGPTLGAYILSEIGDINRFSSSAKLANYVGIAFPVSGSCPTVYLPSHRPSFRIKTLRLRRYIHQSY